jgi:hypothetical protein
MLSTCKNCDAALTGKFCVNCGQKTDVHRITMGYISHEFFHAVTHADKGVLLLIRKLFIQPGIVAREYIEGKRKKYFNPLSFLVITSAIHAYISYKTGYFTAVGSGNQGGSNRRMPAVMVEAFKISNENGKLLTLILIVPLLAFLSWLLFRRSKFLMAETFVLNSFIVGQSHVIRTLIFIPLFLLFPQYGNLNLTAFELLLLVYLIIAYRQFFQQNIFLTIVKCILTMVLFITLYWVCIVLFAWLKHLVFPVS